MTTTTKESEVFETLSLIKYDVNLAQIAKLKAEYMPLVITDLADKDQFEAVHAGRMTMVKVRTTIEKARVKHKASALKYGRDVDAAAKELLTESEPVEAHLQAEEDKVINEQKRLEAEAEEIEKAKIQKRVDTLFAYNVILPYMDVATMDDESYTALLFEAKVKYGLEQNRIADEEAARIQKDKELAEAQAEVDRQQAEQNKKDKEQATKEEALRIEREAFEREKRESEEKKNREAFEIKAKENARIQAEREAKEKIDRETREAEKRAEVAKAETARQEALKPVKQRLIDFAKSITEVPVPEFEDKMAERIVNLAMRDLARISDNIIEQLEEM